MGRICTSQPQRWAASWNGGRLLSGKDNELKAPRRSEKIWNPPANSAASVDPLEREERIFVFYFPFSFFRLSKDIKLFSFFFFQTCAKQGVLIVRGRRPEISTVVDVRLFDAGPTKVDHRSELATWAHDFICNIRGPIFRCMNVESSQKKQKWVIEIGDTCQNRGEILFSFWMIKIKLFF